MTITGIETTGGNEVLELAAELKVDRVRVSVMIAWGQAG